MSLSRLWGKAPMCFSVLSITARSPFSTLISLQKHREIISVQIVRQFSKKPSRIDKSADTKNYTYYVMSLVIVAIGCTFAAIPAYRIFCEQTSFGGLTQVAKDFEKIANMKKCEDRLIRVQFNSDVPSSMRWEFKPQQHEIYVHPGETALAFYTARNPTNKPIIGISSYNLTPFQAAYYFNKIQCFCFEEQILNPGEQVDLPVFFYIDPDYVNDPALEYLDSILLSYTFFEAKSGLKLPDPFDPKNRPSIAPAPDKVPEAKI
uniref:Cytochrome c oxidase assembly protein COX11, mitochondrial n=1 Tax=Caenorhabditis tropicalis TaxID=1561998 RepID=A0A1I7TE70_9PELO